MQKTIYEVFNEKTSIPFETEELANEYIQGTNLGFKIRPVEIPAENQNTFEEQFYKDIAFGKMLVERFLIDNRNLATNFTDSQNLVLLQKFAPIQTLCNSGVIKTARAMLANIAVDNEIDAEGNPIVGAIFTKKRKFIYLAMITDYLTIGFVHDDLFYEIMFTEFITT